MVITLENQLIKTAKALVAPGKGILAADESGGTIKKRFDTIGVESTEENRRAYREILFTTSGAEEFISGVILYDETIRQSASDGTTPFPEVLKKNGIIPGIKVDTGAKALAFSPNEKVTEGLDGLRERFQEYYGMGARFSKWRGVITIGEGIPTDYCLHVNAHALACYAVLSQEAGIVPIVEPEVLMDADNTLEICNSVTERTLKAVFNELRLQKVLLEGMLLKPNMIISGKKCSKQSTKEEIAAATIALFKKVVPSEVPGIVFLSGGQSDIEATVNLNEMNKTKGLPWELSFSYGRALQSSVLAAWGGKTTNVDAAKKAFYHRAKMNSQARFGKYKGE